MYTNNVQFTREDAVFPVKDYGFELAFNIGGELDPTYGSFKVYVVKQVADGDTDDYGLLTYDTTKRELNFSMCSEDATER